MRVTNISILSNGVETISFSLRRADPTARYMARVIEGLDAEELIPKFYARGRSTGDRFHEFATRPRTIAMRLVLNPRFVLNESYSDIRDEIYKAISSHRSGQIEMQFKAAGSVMARIYGFITKVESDLFAPEPEVRVTIECDDGMLRGVNPVILESSQISTINPIIFTDTDSTAPHGFTFEVEFTDPEDTFVITDPIANDWEFEVTPPGGFLAGDHLHFSSEVNNSQIYLVRGGVTTYLMDMVVPNSVWPLLFPGANQFEFEQIDSFNWVNAGWFTSYWGV